MSAKIITSKNLVKGILVQYRNQYPEKRDYSTYAWNPNETYNQLLNLSNNKKLTVTSVNKTIGNDSWTSLDCSQCGKSTNWVMQLGAEPDYESATAYLCKQCLQDVIKLFNTQRQGRK